jgi:hypothetical protein
MIFSEAFLRDYPEQSPPKNALFDRTSEFLVLDLGGYVCYFSNY